MFTEWDFVCKSKVVTHTRSAKQQTCLLKQIHTQRKAADVHLIRSALQQTDQVNPKVPVVNTYKIE